MESELGLVLHDQQADLSFLLGRAALMQGASGQLVAGIVARMFAEQQGRSARHDIQTLMTSVFALLSQESALLKTAFDALSPKARQMLAIEAAEEFTRLAGPYELEVLPTQNEGARQ